MTNLEVLDLSTIVTRKRIRITSKPHPKGKLYEIRNGIELSLWDVAVVETAVLELAGLDPKKKPTAAQQRAHRKALVDIVEVVAPSIEPRVLQEMPDMLLLAVYGVFGSGDEEADPGNARGAQTSGASSPASNASTRATRRGGSTSRSGS